MKVVSAHQMALLEAEAYRDGSSESDFMEEAGSGIALIAHDLVEYLNLDRHIILLCGKGNNAGDAYVAGVQLLHLEYDVTAYQFFPLHECSQLCQEHHLQFLNEGGRLHTASNAEEINLPTSGLIIDGLFGTGFRGQIEEPIAAVIRLANQSHLPILSVDIPSGLDGASGQVEGDAIMATVTAFLGLPKTGFFLRQGWDHVGRLSYVDFGLPKEYIETAEAEMVMLSPDMLKALLPPLKRSRHKYEAGHVVGLAGSPAMPGASILASSAALCGGAGIVHLLHPEGMEANLAAGPYELLHIPYKNEETEKIVEWLNRATATFIGPGLGVTPDTRKLLKQVLPQLTKPSVLDADALTIIAEDKIALPPNCVLTPHLRELKRLLKVDKVDLGMEFLRRCQDWAAEKRVTLLLKGGPTFIFHPHEPIMVCPRGDPGMATAGSGDVLTGLIASLLAQGLTSQHAAMLGVYIHAVAGEWAAAGLTSYCMTASDIINYFSDAFQPAHWVE